MEFTYAHSGPAVFFLVEGSLTVNASLHRLRAAIGGIADPKVGGVFLDLGRVTRVDCTGIGELIGLRRLVMAAGRTFGLINVGRRDRRLLEMARLDTVLGIYENATAALGSIAAQAPRNAPSTMTIRRESRGPHLPLSCESATVGS